MRKNWDRQTTNRRTDRHQTVALCGRSQRTNELPVGSDVNLCRQTVKDATAAAAAPALRHSEHLTCGLWSRQTEESAPHQHISRSPKTAKIKIRTPLKWNTYFRFLSKISDMVQTTIFSLI